MVRKPDIQYIEQFFVPGAEAPQVQPQWGQKTQPAAAPQKRPEPKIRIILDPVALTALVVAVTMLVLMGVGIVQFRDAIRERDAMSEYLTKLQDENLNAKYDYYSDLDLELIGEQALALGMIPAEQAQHIQVKVTVPQPEPEPTWWENVCWFLEGLFA